MSTKYNCPDCWAIHNEESNPCLICKKATQSNTWDYQKMTNPYLKETTYKANPCDGCTNNPNNGGSGICFCTLGNQIKITI